MKLDRNYLTSEEIAYVVGQVSMRNDYVEREVLKVGLVAQLLISELEGKYEDNSDIYNEVMKNEIKLECEIINYNIIDKLVEKNIGIESALTNLINQFSSKLETDIKEATEKFDMNVIVNKLSELMNNKGVDK